MPNQHTSSKSNNPAPAVVSPDSARSAVKLGVMRYVLAISLAGVILGMFVAWFIYA
ncbi:MAG TPA: hypothetical protein VJ890_01490 [Vineibacter sp.]|nr:hypothetical protein [Vineibacter sp.]